ncbi:MAG: EAL domain-containing protein [Cyanothece sp. SIO1E1]|nr:EAL domain-containing protein [Cyanothece sp. SIO1E1]
MHCNEMARSQTDILIVDDNLDNLNVLSGMLTQHHYKIRRAINGALALKTAQALPPDLILLDINMPDMDGYTVCQTLKSDAKTREIPVIFLSASGETLNKIQAFNAGGLDYITKPFEIAEVLARIQNQLSLQSAKAEIRQLNATLEKRVIQRTAELAEELMERRRVQVKLEAEVIERRQIQAKLEAEILERQQAQEKLLYLALHDPLTDLPNRTWLMQRLEQAIDQVKHQPDAQFAVLFLDCDRFKVVNDSLGHLVGDQLLMEVSHRLVACLSRNSTLARLGGDEFLIFLERVDNINDAEQVAQKLQHALTLPFCLAHQKIFISASMGIVLGTAAYDRPQDLLRDVDTAMYQAKSCGKAQYKVFDTNMYHHARERLQLETELRQAVERQEFVLHYQPIVSLVSGRLAGFEALVRWHHPKQGFISPTRFIPVAEETGLIVPIGLWVLREACYQFHIWQQEIPAQASPPGGSRYSPTLKISVNLSVKQFVQPDLLEQIDHILQETGFNGESLKLEITESAIMENAESATLLLQELKSRQIQLAIDDFGTGYSSLSYLHRFPVDILKIDRSFIHGMDKSSKNPEIVQATMSLVHYLSIVQATVDLAHHLDLDVIAEGVETKEQLAQLRVLGCKFAQGNFFSKPLDKDAARAIIAADPRW